MTGNQNLKHEGLKHEQTPFKNQISSNKFQQEKPCVNLNEIRSNTLISLYFIGCKKLPRISKPSPSATRPSLQLLDSKGFRCVFHSNFLKQLLTNFQQLLKRPKTINKKTFSPFRLSVNAQITDQSPKELGDHGKKNLLEICWKIVVYRNYFCANVRRT